MLLGGPLLVPPNTFGVVLAGVYRFEYPARIHHGFIETLALKNVLLLSPESLSKEAQIYFSTRGINMVYLLLLLPHSSDLLRLGWVDPLGKTTCRS